MRPGQEPFAVDGSGPDRADREAQHALRLIRRGTRPRIADRQAEHALWFVLPGIPVVGHGSMVRPPLAVSWPSERKAGDAVVGWSLGGHIALEAGHAPHLETPGVFTALLTQFLAEM